MLKPEHQLFGHLPYGAHLCKFVYSLKTMVNTLGEELRKFLVVEDLE